MKIEMVPVDKIRAASWNPREITEKAKAALRRGLEEFGLVEPLIVAREDGELLGGHQRFALLREMGHETVPVVYVEGLSPARRKALAVLLNNQEAQGTWKPGELSAILAELAASDPVTVDLTGFSPDFVEQLTGAGTGTAGGLVERPIRPAPRWTWLVCAIETQRFVEIAAHVEAIAAAGPAFLEVQGSDQNPPGGSDGEGV